MPEFAVTVERPTLGTAARKLSRQVVGMVRPDHVLQCLVVNHCRTEPPKNFMGWPVRWERG